MAKALSAGPAPRRTVFPLVAAIVAVACVPRASPLRPCVVYRRGPGLVRIGTQIAARDPAAGSAAVAALLPSFAAAPGLHRVCGPHPVLAELRACARTTPAHGAVLLLRCGVGPGGGALRRWSRPGLLAPPGLSTSRPGRVVAIASKKEGKGDNVEDVGPSSSGRSREKVKSPMTGRLINVGGPAYQKIIDLGYILIDGQLVHRNCVQEGIVDAQCSVSWSMGPEAAGGHGKKSKKAVEREVDDGQHELRPASGGEGGAGGPGYVVEADEEVDNEVNLMPSGSQSLLRDVPGLSGDLSEPAFMADSFVRRAVFDGGARPDVADDGVDGGDWEVDSLQIDEGSISEDTEFSAPFWMRWRDEQLLAIFNELKDEGGKVGLIQVGRLLLLLSRQIFGDGKIFCIMYQ